MILHIPAGRYVVAVSGGVDSMVLLDLLRKNSKLELIVSHFDHGIRANSQKDEEFVQSVAMSHNITYVSERARLGSCASEDAARQARYNFLRRICKKYNAHAIITAHHQDDLLETALINLLRGTGWRGLASLRSTAKILRPLIGMSKADIMTYAKQHNLAWREDFTNADTRYLRNNIRHNLLAGVSPRWRQQMLRNIVRQNEYAIAIDNDVETWIGEHIIDMSTAPTLSRHQIIMMPEHVAHEIFQAIFRRVSGKSIERPLMQKAILFCKVAKSGKIFQINRHWQLRVTKKDVIVEAAPGMIS